MEFKSLENYSIRKDRWGIYRQCIPCRTQKSYRWRDNNKHKFDISVKNHRIKNRETVKEIRNKCQKKYYERNKDIIREKRKLQIQTPEYKAYRKKYLRRWYDIWDIVLYLWVKYKIKEITKRWYRIMRFWDCQLFIIARKHLTPLKHKPLY